MVFLRSFASVLVLLLAVGLGVARYKVISFKRTNFNAQEYIEDSRDGDQQRYRFPVTAAESQGEKIVAELLVRAGCVKSGARPDRPGSPPEHYHKTQDETFEVVAGTMSAIINGTEHKVHAGQSVTIPKGVVHTYWNAEKEDLFMNITLTPAGKGEGMFQTFAAIGYEYGDMGKVNPLQLLHSLIWNDVVIAEIPAPVWQVLEIVVPRLATIMGYKPTYPEHVTARPAGLQPATAQS